jgi:Gpi18-like mannosyltransferase
VADASSTEGLLGLLSGLVLLGLFAASLAITLEPLVRERDLSVARALLWLFAIAIGKFALLPSFPGYWDDVRCWNLWSGAMAYAGPPHIYDPQYVCDYPPGYLYVLWVAGNVTGALGLRSFDAIRLVTESPPLIVDFILGLTIFAATRRFGPARAAFSGMLLFALNPALLFDSVAWGQSDSVLVLPILLSAMLIVDRRYELAWAMAAIAVLIKPQGLILLPVLGLWTLIRGRLADWVAAAAAFVGTLMIGIAPFQIGRPWNLLFNIYFSAAGRYPMTSDNAYNLLGMLGGLKQPDSVRIAGVSAFALGMTLFLSVYAIAGWILYRKRTPHALFVSIFLAYLAMFVLAPRIHERYLYPAVAIMVLFALESRVTIAIFAALSSTFLFNLAYVKRLHEQDLWNPPNARLVSAAALINLAALVVAVVYGLSAESEAEDAASPRASSTPPKRGGRLVASGPARRD